MCCRVVPQRFLNCPFKSGVYVVLNVDTTNKSEINKDTVF